VRRELWENRSVYLAPLAVAVLVLLASSISVVALPHPAREVPARAVLARPFRLAPAPILLATFVVGVFYSLDALYGERRERCLLFWKSLPVSDLLTTVSKASVPLVALPLIGLVLSLAVQTVLLVLATAVLGVSGVSPAAVWAELRLPEIGLVMVYGTAAHVLWFSPLYGWLLLVSAWARRAPALWALLPPLAIAAGERILFGSALFLSVLKYRLAGAMTEAFVAPAQGRSVQGLSELAPLRFLLSPGLFLGLLATAAFLAAAARQRRNRGLF